MSLFFGGQGVTPAPKTASNVVELQAGQTWLLSPAGWYAIRMGRYTSFQEYDPITTTWRTIGAGSTGGGTEYVYSDGVNFRLANQTGCVVGALLTTAGSGYSSSAPPTWTAAAGVSKFVSVVGGALNTSVTVTNGGSNYTYPPFVIISAPPSPGVQATAYCTLSGGAVSTVTLIDQGAGYTSPPQITFVNDPREGVNNTTVGYNAAAVCTLTGAGTVTALLCIDHGTPVTSVPALTSSSGSAAATAIMCWAVTAYVVSSTTAGSGYAAPVVISGYGGFPATNPAYTNPTTQSALVRGRAAQIIGAVSAGALTTTGQVVNDGGVYPGAPTMYVASASVTGTGGVQAVLLTPTMGGVNDVSFVGSM